MAKTRNLSWTHIFGNTEQRVTLVVNTETNVIERMMWPRPPQFPQLSQRDTLDVMQSLADNVDLDTIGFDEDPEAQAAIRSTVAAWRDLLKQQKVEGRTISLPNISEREYKTILMALSAITKEPPHGCPLNSKEIAKLCVHLNENKADV